MSDLFLRRAFPGLTCREGVPVEEKTAVFIDILFVFHERIEAFRRAGQLLEAVGEEFLDISTRQYVVFAEDEPFAAVRAAVDVLYLAVAAAGIDPEYFRVKILVARVQPLGAERKLHPVGGIKFSHPAKIIEIGAEARRFAQVSPYGIIG